jgi:hypothetical protein
LIFFSHDLASLCTIVFWVYWISPTVWGPAVDMHFWVYWISPTVWGPCSGYAFLGVLDLSDRLGPLQWICISGCIGSLRPFGAPAVDMHFWVYWISLTIWGLCSGYTFENLSLYSTLECAEFSELYVYAPCSSSSKVACLWWSRSHFCSSYDTTMAPGSFCTWIAQTSHQFLWTNMRLFQYGPFCLHKHTSLEHPLSSTFDITALFIFF